MPDRPAVVVLISGSGTTMAAVLAAAADREYPAQVVAVVSDRADAAGLELAAAAGVATFVCAPADFPDRATWCAALAEAVAAHEPDLILSAGFMRILDEAFVGRFAPRLINSHPSLLPAFPGGRAVADALAHGVAITGATVHLVDTGVDTGPILAQVAVPVLVDDDEATLHERIKQAERAQLVEVVAQLAGAHIEVDGRKVRVS